MDCLQEFLYTNTKYDDQLYLSILVSSWWCRELAVRTFEVSSSWALQSQCGGPRRLLSSWVSLSSLPWTCSAPTLWAVSMAAMLRWAYLMEPSSGREISGKGGRSENICVYIVWHVFFNLMLTETRKICCVMFCYFDPVVTQTYYKHIYITIIHFPNW